MKNLSHILSIFGDEVHHLHGNLFRVKRKIIKLANQGLVSENGNLIYGNPRWFKNRNGNQEAKGINEKSKMEELRNSIQDEGLENPIRLRILENEKTLEVINGERRFRSIEELCNKNLKCFDPFDGQQKDAQEIFEWIDARIDFMDDKTAIRVALKPNETSETIGDLANLNVVKIMRECNYDDQEILKATGKSISWLRETDRIISLDEVSFDHFSDEKINRKVALHLSQIEDVEERLQLLEKITISAIQRQSEKKKIIEEKKNKAKNKVEIEEAQIELAEKYGEEENLEIHKEKLNKVKNKIKKLENESDNIDKETPTATSKDIKNIVKPLSHNKIKSIFIETINYIIENEGFDENGNSFGYDLDILKNILFVLESIMSGEKDVIQVLENCLGNQEDESDEDESDEDESDEDESDEDESDEDESDEDDYGEDDYDYDDEEETPIELEREFEEAAFDDEDYD